jgi:hypothetical protein
VSEPDVGPLTEPQQPRSVFSHYDCSCLPTAYFHFTSFECFQKHPFTTSSFISALQSHRFTTISKRLRSWTVLVSLLPSLPSSSSIHIIQHEQVLHNQHQLLTAHCTHNSQTSSTSLFYHYPHKFKKNDKQGNLIHQSALLHVHTHRYWRFLKTMLTGTYIR